MAELSPKTVTFINRQGQKEDRQIYSPGQIQGFLNTGFQVVSNPFDAEKVASTDSLAGTMTQQATAPTQTNTVQNFNTEMVKPTTISSTQADGEYYDNQKWLQDEQTRLNEQIAQRQKEQEDLIRTRYQARGAQLKREQGEETKSMDVLQFRLGRKDTMYGQGEMSDLAERQRGEISALQSEMNNLISEMKRAVENDEYTKFKTLQTAYNERMDQQLKLKQEMRAQQAFDLEVLMKSREQQAQLVDQIAPNLYNELLDSEDPTSVLQDYSKRYKVDPTILSSSLIKYGNEQRKEDILRTKDSLDAIKQFADLGGTGEFEIPGYGKVNVLSKGITGNYILEKVNGQYVAFDKDTGQIKSLGFGSGDVTPGGITGLVSYLSSPSYSVNKITGTSTVVPPEPGTPQYEEGLNTILEQSKSSPEYEQLFSEYVKQQEELRGMSIANRESLRGNFDKQFAEQIRSVYDEEIKNPAPENIEEVDLSQFSQTTQDIIKGITTLKEVKDSYGTSASNKAIYRRIKEEVDTAKRLGIAVGGADDFEAMANVEQALSSIPVQLRNSEAELERYKSLVEKGLAEGKTPEQVSDRLIGWKITTPSSFSNNLRSRFGSAYLDSTKISEIARNINNGNNAQALRIFESGINNAMREQAPDAFISEATVLNAYNGANQINNYVKKLQKSGSSPVGVVSGTMEKWLGKLKSKEATNVAGQIVTLVADLRNKISGSAVTANETAFLDPIIPNLSDTPANFMIKLNNLAAMPARKLNALRQQFGLPALSPQTLSDMNARVKLYQ